MVFFFLSVNIVIMTTATTVWVKLMVCELKTWFMHKLHAVMKECLNTLIFLTGFRMNMPLFSVVSLFLVWAPLFLACVSSLCVWTFWEGMSTCWHYINLFHGSCSHHPHLVFQNPHTFSLLQVITPASFPRYLKFLSPLFI